MKLVLGFIANLGIFGFTDHYVFSVTNCNILRHHTLTFHFFSHNEVAGQLQSIWWTIGSTSPRGTSSVDKVKHVDFKKHVKITSSSILIIFTVTVQFCSIVFIQSLNEPNGCVKTNRL